MGFALLSCTLSVLLFTLPKISFIIYFLFCYHMGTFLHCHSIKPSPLAPAVTIGTRILCGINKGSIIEKLQMCVKKDPQWHLRVTEMTEVCGRTWHLGETGALAGTDWPGRRFVVSVEAQIRLVLFWFEHLYLPTLSQLQKKNSNTFTADVRSVYWGPHWEKRQTYVGY